jgi:2-polyprenyl-3-methyl-5-hydroxy-6-metoxy-1,4-benzoquinol methylase
LQEKQPSAAVSPEAAASYRGYVAWKGWDRLFACSAEDARYFAGETRGLAVAGADVLEIGFGSGSFLDWAQKQGACVTGVEIIPELVEAARERGIALLPTQLEAVAFAHAESFDTIVAFDVFEHLPVDLVATRLATCARMLRAGGHLLLRFPNGQSPFGLVPQAGDPTHLSKLSRGAIEHLMHGTGFEVVRYAPSFRIAGGGPAKALARRLRYVIRDIISAALNAIYAESIPWDPVVVIILRKRAG